MYTNAFRIATVVAVSALLTSGLVLAQPGDRDRGPRMHGPEARLAMLTERLDLSDQQAVDMLQLLQTAEASREARHQAYLDDNRAEICAEKAAFHEDILAILDEEQALEFEAMVEQHHERAQKRRGHRGEEPIDCSGVDGS